MAGAAVTTGVGVAVSVGVAVGGGVGARGRVMVRGRVTGRGRDNPRPDEVSGEGRVDDGAEVTMADGVAKAGEVSVVGRDVIVVGCDVGLIGAGSLGVFAAIGGGSGAMVDRAVKRTAGGAEAGVAIASAATPTTGTSTAMMPSRRLAYLIIEEPGPYAGDDCSDG